jgi:TolA-binding protein
VAPVEPQGTVAAKDLFAEANARRRAGDDESAKRLYLELQSRYPTSDEAQISRIALGRLLLDRAHAPAAALAQFDAFLSRSSQSGLAQEALFGRATALGQLGRQDDEARTWRALLDRFPESIYAERAKTRLRSLQ